MKQYIVICILAMMSFHSQAGDDKVTISLSPSPDSLQVISHHNEFEQVISGKDKSKISLKLNYFKEDNNGNREKESKEIKIPVEAFDVFYENITTYYTDSIGKLVKTNGQLHQKVQQLDSINTNNGTTIQTLEKENNIFKILTSDSISVFQENLPDIREVPNCLLTRYTTIRETKKLLAEAIQLNTDIEDMIQRQETLKNSKSVIMDSINNLVLEWKKLIEEYNKLDIRDLSKSQKNYVVEILYDPYISIVNTYFKN